MFSFLFFLSLTNCFTCTCSGAGLDVLWEHTLCVLALENIITVCNVDLQQESLSLFPCQAAWLPWLSGRNNRSPISPICLLVAAFHPHSAVHLSVTDAPAGAGIQRSDLSPLLLSGSVSLRLPGLWIGWDCDWHLFEQMWSPLSECDSLVSEHKCVFKWRRLNVCSFTIGQDWLQTRWCSTSGPQWTHTWTNAH